jgi:sugar lactone lactonase YvrE
VPAATPAATPSGAGSPVPDAQLRRPEGIALDRDGNVWVADYGRDRVVKLSPDGRLLQTIGSRGSAAGEFVGPKGIAVDPSTGRLYIADTGNARIQRLAPDGTPDTSWSLPPTP